MPNKALRQSCVINSEKGGKIGKIKGMDTIQKKATVKNVTDALWIGVHSQRGKLAPIKADPCLEGV